MEWVEFKRNDATQPEEIGEYISALANAATLVGKETAYLIWGVTDGTHEIVGTKFKPRKTKGSGASFKNVDSFLRLTYLLRKESEHAKRGNSRLKDSFGLRVVRVQGNANVHLHIMFGVLALFAEQVGKTKE